MEETGLQDTITPLTAADETPRPLPVILRERVQRLASVRRQQQTAEEMLRVARLAFEAEHRELIDLARELREMELTLELDIKAGAAKHFKATGEKTPCPGVAIRVGTVYDINEAEAWPWIREHKLEAQLTKPATLDEKAIAKVAGATSLPFITTLEKVTPTIATDLDAALARAEEAA